MTALGGVSRAKPKALQTRLASAHGVAVSLGHLKSHLQACRRKAAPKETQGSMPATP